MLATWQIIVLILLSFFSIFDMISLNIGMQYPVIVGTVVGIIVGDIQLGLMIGATLQLMVLGVGTYGGASIPDFTSGAIIGTVFAHTTGNGLEFALALAVPVGLLMVQLDVLARFANTFFLHQTDKSIDQADPQKVANNIILGIIPWGLSRMIPIAIMLIFGQNVVDFIVNRMPDWLMGGLEVAGGLLPVVGIAVLLKYLPTASYFPYLLVGFFFASYLEIPMLGVAMIGLALAIIHFKQANKKAEAVTVGSQLNENTSEGELDDGEYEE
ncbi:PTS sorbose transporter subunit IIC [Tetragenococcus halophilus subsp. flandriensis]|uniref:PTS mannose/fructose/sorbose/N-acetylgalactosamine transporter subunit IIC n=1 Tax=Tetragenococcus halophilus TaxID=51669 RepID=UPI0023E9ED44|nr:PTS sugar transporter subunit IIC [Tetragenococcus halophilus]GMA08201.1 PTS sorbose transporter subunit IIC [Tetragenococcus halophilus subsp. flandriensis]